VGLRDQLLHESASGLRVDPVEVHVPLDGELAGAELPEDPGIQARNRRLEVLVGVVQRKRRLPIEDTIKLPEDLALPVGALDRCSEHDLGDVPVLAQGAYPGHRLLEEAVIGVAAILVAKVRLFGFRIVRTARHSNRVARAKGSADRWWQLELPSRLSLDPLRLPWPGEPVVACLSEAMNCVRCGDEMERRPVRGVLLDYCTACNAVWLDGGELESLKYGLEARQAELATRAAVEAREEMYRIVEVQGLCPRCQSRLEVTDFGGVEVDRCRSCGGTYFDHGELQQVLRLQSPNLIARLWRRIRHLRGR
jgi:Zn-finger nucleic acid-binding protein